MSDFDKGLDSFMNRLWLRTTVALFCIVQIFAHVQFGFAEEDTPAEKLLPKDTLFFFTVSDIPELKEKWQKTSMGQLFQDPLLKPFLDEVAEKKEELSKDVEKEIGVSIDDLLDLPQGELTFALIEKPERTLSAILLLEYGENKETIDTLLKKMDEALEKSEADHLTEEIHDVKVHVYKLKADEDNPIKTLVYFADEDYVVFSNELDAIKEVLLRWDGKSDDTLAENDQYKYIQAQCKGESEGQIKLFLTPSGLISTGISIAQTTFPQAAMASGFLPLLGLDGLKGYGGTITIDEGDFESIANFFVYVERPQGLIGLFQFPSIQQAPAKWIPATVASYAGINWDVATAYKSVEGLIDSIQGKGQTARFLDQLADQGPNIHIKKDFLDHLDGKIQFVQGEPKQADEDAPPIPSIFATLGLKDAAKMKKTLASLAKAIGPLVETREFNGETIYEGQLPGGDTTISFAIAEGQLVITNDTPMLEGMMRGRTGQGAPLADSPEYKRIAKVFPAKTSMQSFQRTDVQLKVYYEMLRKADPESLGGIDGSKLPPFEKISKYLIPGGGYAVPDKKGAKSVNFSLKAQ